MDEMEWNSLVIEVNNYLAADDQLDASLRQVVELNLQVGNNNPNERTAATNALKALLRGRDGTPFRRGQKSKVPAAARVAIDRVCGVVHEAALAYYGHDAVPPNRVSGACRHGYSRGDEDPHACNYERRRCALRRPRGRPPPRRCPGRDRDRHRRRRPSSS